MGEVLVYSLLMHMFLYKGQLSFEKEITLERKRDEVDFPTQCWTRILDKDDKRYNFLVFRNVFASRIRRALVCEPPRIPKEINEVLRPKEIRHELNFSHN